MKPSVVGVAGVAMFVIIVTGCGALAAKPPSKAPQTTVPRVASLDPLVERMAKTHLRALAANSIHRAAEEMTVRIRNINCEGLALGSGFAISPHVLITNRHVLAGASVLEVNTWDGRDDTVSTAAVGALGDLGVASVDQTLPHVAQFGTPAEAGDLVTVVGYPLGGPLTFAQGVVIDRVDGRPFGIDGGVLRITARVEHGNSGGPVFDTRGRVVGVVFAIETATGFGLAIPTDTVIALAQTGGFEDVPACGMG